jgi:hypothetical protein
MPACPARTRARCSAAPDSEHPRVKMMMLAESAISATTSAAGGCTGREPSSLPIAHATCQIARRATRVTAGFR